MKSAVELSAKYIHDRKLPDKAIDVIDETGASQMLLPERQRRKMLIGVKEVEFDDRHHGADFRQDDLEVGLRGAARHRPGFSAVVFGQDRAIEALAAAIKLSRAGLREPEKPIGCYMFSGRPASARPGRAPARDAARRRAAPLRHERIYGAP